MGGEPRNDCQQLQVRLLGRAQVRFDFLVALGEELSEGLWDLVNGNHRGLLDEDGGGVRGPSPLAGSCGGRLRVDALGDLAAKDGIGSLEFFTE